MRYKDKNEKIELTFLHGLDVVENGKYRVYPYSDVLQPVLGYTKNIFKGKFTKIEGVKGLEKYYDDILKANKDGLIVGRKDVVSRVILDEKTVFDKAENGYNLHINVDLKVQKLVESILDRYKESLDAREIVACNG